MRIVQIGQFPLSPDIIRGGVESSVYGLASEQAAIHSVFVLDLPRFECEDSVDRMEEMIVYRFRNKGKHQKDSLSRITDILRVILSLKPDICHLHGTGPFNWKLYKALRNSKMPVVVTVHGLINVEKRKLLKKHFSLKALYQLVVQSSAERKLLSAVKEIIVDTKYVEEAIRKYHLISVPHMTVIPQGIDQRFYQLSCSKDSRVVLSVGAIAKRKGHLLLIQSFERLCKMAPDAHLTICGSLAETDYYGRIIEHLASSPFKDRISILTDVPREVLCRLYSQAHLFALHSQEESQGIALAEAMATGLPVVSTKVGGIPYVVTDGKTGLLVDYGDIASFSAAIEHILTLRDDWVKMSQDCRNAAQSYSWGIISEAVSQVYNSILNDIS